MENRFRYSLLKEHLEAQLAGQGQKTTEDILAGSTLKDTVDLLSEISLLDWLCKRALTHRLVAMGLLDNFGQWEVEERLGSAWSIKTKGDQQLLSWCLEPFPSEIVTDWYEEPLDMDMPESKRVVTRGDVTLVYAPGSGVILLTTNLRYDPSQKKQVPGKDPLEVRYPWLPKTYLPFLSNVESSGFSVEGYYADCGRYELPYLCGVKVYLDGWEAAIAINGGLPPELDSEARALGFQSPGSGIWQLKRFEKVRVHEPDPKGVGV